MPINFIPLYATIALALSAIITVPFFTIPAFAEPDNSLRLGFLNSIDDPSQLHIVAVKTDAPAAQSEVHVDIGQSTAAWQRGLGPVWIWNPPVEEAKLAVIASR